MKILFTSIIPVSLTLFLTASPCAEEVGKLLFEDTFDWQEPSEKGWSGHTRKKGFQVIEIKDGAMQINMAENSGHATYAARKMLFNKVSVQFRFKLSAANDELRVNFNDKTKSFMKEFHAGHLCSVQITTEEVKLVDSIGKYIAKKQFEDEGQKELTKEQRMDIGKISSKSFPVSLKAEKWYSAKYDADGEDVTLWIDGKLVGSRTSKGAAHPNKTLFRFVSPQGSPQVDDLKIYSLEKSG